MIRRIHLVQHPNASCTLPRYATAALPGNQSSFCSQCYKPELSCIGIKTSMIEYHRAIKVFSFSWLTLVLVIMAGTRNKRLPKSSFVNSRLVVQV